MVRGGSGRQRPGHPRTALAQQAGSEEVLSQVAQRLHLCTSGDHSKGEGGLGWNTRVSDERLRLNKLTKP